MMAALAGLGLVLFIGVTSVVGLRLLWRARQTRGGAELLCGLAFTSIAVIGYPASILAGAGATVGELHMLPYVVGTLFDSLGIAFFYAFAWVVFRRNDAWAGTLAWAAWGGLALGCAGLIGTVQRAPAEAPMLQVGGAWQSMLQLLSIGCFAWMAVEGFLHAGRASKRLALGLADPVVVDRFRLFGLFGVSTTLLSGVFVLSRLLGEVPGEGVVLNIGCGFFGTLSSSFVALAFVPPRFYLARLRRRSPPPA